MRRRRRRARASGSSDPRETAQKLIGLALDGATSVDERRSAAVRAVEYIDRHDLLARPFEGHKTAQAAVDVLDRLTDPGVIDGLKELGATISAAARRR